MKYACVLLFFSVTAMAHGSLPEQAASAAHVAAEMLEQSQPREVLRKMQSMTATKVGHEQFDVVFALDDGTQFTFGCEENETVEPVVWECVSRR